ncbi:MAG: hypothetical protein ACRDSP_09655 [Pseudonocardiaceae bacterium]
MDDAPFVSQTAKTRCAVEGRLVNGGGACTVVLVRESAGWILYPHGITGLAVHIAESDAAKVATTILRNLG